jgi:Tfp pilus assembly protein PilO
MDRPALSEPSWRVRHELSRLGVPGLAGLTLVALAAGIHFAMTRPAADEALRLRVEESDLRQKLRAAASGEAPRTLSHAEKLQQFYAYFPPVSATPELLRALYQAADARGLVLQSGEYKLILDRDFRLARYQIVLPVRGSYASLRDFVGDTLKALPTVVLDDISLKRESVGATALDAQVRFTLYLGGGE